MKKDITFALEFSKKKKKFERNFQGIAKSVLGEISDGRNAGKNKILEEFSKEMCNGTDYLFLKRTAEANVFKKKNT